MSGPFEKYAEQAAAELELHLQDVERVVAFVAPLIAEDARERMVAAAGKALEREGTATPIAVHQRFPDDGVDYCGWHVGSGVVHDGCGEVWPCSTVRSLQERS